MKHLILLFITLMSSTAIIAQVAVPVKHLQLEHLSQEYIRDNGDTYVNINLDELEPDSKQCAFGGLEVTIEIRSQGSSTYSTQQICAGQDQISASNASIKKLISVCHLSEDGVYTDILFDYNQYIKHTYERLFSTDYSSEIPIECDPLLLTLTKLNKT